MQQQQTEKKRILWVPELTAVVKSMEHPTLDNAKDADIQSFDDTHDAAQAREDLKALHRDNHMGLVAPADYEYYGIERKMINGAYMIAKTSDPFKIRANRILENAKQLAEAEPESVDQVKGMLQAMTEKIAQLELQLENQSGDEDVAAVLSAEKSRQDAIQADNKEAEDWADD